MSEHEDGDAGEREALLPCPFCGCDLVPNTNQADMMVRRYGTHYDHTQSLCHLSEHEVRPIEVEDWNRRAAPPIAPGERGAFELLCKLVIIRRSDRYMSSDPGALAEWNALWKSAGDIAAKAQAPAEPVAWQERQGRRINRQTGEVTEWSRWYECSTPLPGMSLAHTNSDDRIPREWRPLYAAAPKAPAENTSAGAQLSQELVNELWDKACNDPGTPAVECFAQLVLDAASEAGKAPAQPV